jgi:hypothetical protein
VLGLFGPDCDQSRNHGGGVQHSCKSLSHASNPLPGPQCRLGCPPGYGGRSRVRIPGRLHEIIKVEPRMGEAEPDHRARLEWRCGCWWTGLLQPSRFAEPDVAR